MMGICENCAFMNRALEAEPCKSCDRFSGLDRFRWDKTWHVADLVQRLPSNFVALSASAESNAAQITEGLRQQLADIVEVKTNPDPTNPEHYKTPGPEVIELTRHMNFNRGNAVKYLCRAGKKQLTENQEVEDLKKAIWYIEDEIQRLTGVGDHAK